MRNIVFVGGGGTGMATLILVLQELGFHNLVCINDSKNQNTELYEALGIQTIYGDGGDYEVTPDDVVIYSNIKAIKEGPVVSQSFALQAQSSVKNYHRPYSYNEFLGELSKHFTTISFAGSNGKSSITGMAAYTASKLMPNFALALVPAFLPDYGNKNFVINPNLKPELVSIFNHIFTQKGLGFDHALLKKYLLILEACEYQENFLLYDTDFAVITNIDHDHTDYYPLYEDYVAAFIQFARRVRYDVFVSQQAFEQISLYIKNYSDAEEVFAHIHVVESNPHIPFTHLFGEHHQMNAGKVMALYRALETELGVEPLYPADRWPPFFADFKGLRRRMELLHSFANGALLYTDYSHHAPAMAANLKALRAQFPDKKLIAIFQPHQAKRVIEGWDHFAEPLRQFDEAIIYKLYTARESVEDFDFSLVTQEAISSFDQLGEVFAKHCGARYVVDFAYIKDLLDTLSPDSVVVLFTAGDLDYKVRSLF